MKKVLLLIPLLCFSAISGASQTVSLLKDSYPLRRKIDVGLRVGLYPYVSFLNKDHAGLFLSDPYGNTIDMTLMTHTISVDVPANLQLGMLLLSGSAGIKWLGYTPIESKIRGLNATKTVSYPVGFSNGYLSSFWGTCSASIGVITLSFLKLGVSFDFFLGANKKSNPDNSFLSIGENSYSRIVPAFFVEAGFPTAHFRIALRAGFETRSHLDALSLYRITGVQQLHVDGGLSPILGVLMTYKIYSSYGKYHVYY